MNHSTVVTSLFLLILALAIIPTLLSRLRIPTIVGFILSGVLVGPSGFGLISSVPSIEWITEAGILLLMFAIGLEISFGHILKALKSFVFLGFLQVIVTSAVGFGFFAVMGFPVSKSLVMGALFSLSSTAIVIKLLNENQDLQTIFGSVCIFILVAQDIAALPMMSVLPLISAGVGIGVVDYFPLLKMILFFGVFLAAGKILLPKIIDQVLRTGSREIFFFFVIALAMGTAIAAEKIGLSLSLGAFLAGIVISESPYSEQVLAETTPFRENFLGLFFASIGLMLDISFVSNNLGTFIVFVPVLFFLKFIVIYLIVRLNRYPHGVSMASALALSQVGEFSFILAAKAKGIGIFQEIDFQYFLAFSILSLAMTPFLYRIAQLVSGSHSFFEILDLMRNRVQAEQENDIEGNNQQNSERVIVVGLGHAGQNVLRILKNEGVPALGIDFNGAIIKKLESEGYSVFFGDATRPDIWNSKKMKNFHLVVITLTGKHLTAQVLAKVHALFPRVPVVVRAHLIRELPKLKFRLQDQIVIGELETAKTIVRNVLENLEFPRSKISQILSRCEDNEKDLLKSHISP